MAQKKKHARSSTQKKGGKTVAQQVKHFAQEVIQKGTKRAEKMSELLFSTDHAPSASQRKKRNKNKKDIVPVKKRLSGI
jgi:hypothetical protein